MQTQFSQQVRFVATSIDGMMVSEDGRYKLYRLDDYCNWVLFDGGRFLGEFVTLTEAIEFANKI